MTPQSICTMCRDVTSLQRTGIHSSTQVMSVFLGEVSCPHPRGGRARVQLPSSINTLNLGSATACCDGLAWLSSGR